jgi:hopanoid biosynthesis associated protein HpnK
VKRLIVNADDFGLSEGINQAVMLGHRQGIITSATLMANGAGFATAVEMARTAAALGVGVHLNLTEGTPVSAPSGIPSLVNARGLFTHTVAQLGWHSLAGSISLLEVERELRAQIEKVLAAGVAVTHLDGHKHVHLTPAIGRIVLRLATEYGIRGLRCPCEGFTDVIWLLRHNPRAAPRLLRQYGVSRMLWWQARRVSRACQRAGLQHPAGFYGLTATGFLDTEVLQRIICQLPEGTSELMCHPGYVDDQLQRTPTRLLAQRERELQALVQPEIRRLIAQEGVALISYRDLRQPG